MCNAVYEYYKAGNGGRNSMKMKLKKIGWILLCVIGALFLWGATTDNLAVWPVRNTLDYHMMRAWHSFFGEPDRNRTGYLQGKVISETDAPVPGASVVIAEWDGKVHLATSGADGIFRMEDVPQGFYRLSAVAPGFDPGQSEGILRGVTVRAGMTARETIRLKATRKKQLPALTGAQFSDPQVVTCKSPVPGTAVRETLTFSKESGYDERLFVYRPVGASSQPLPVLVTVYPGFLDTWECVSVGQAVPGYAVIAMGPGYSMDLTKDVDGLQRLVALVKSGGLPGFDSKHVAALGGSYSALLLELLMMRDSSLSAVVLLGAPTDMFDFRRRFERDGFFPPFGLDKALVALGAPDRDPLRYLKHSMVYQVRPGLPPTILFHSYQDDIVPYQQSGLLAEALRRNGVDAELHVFDGASHYLLEDGDTALSIYYKMLAFLKRQGVVPVAGGR